jgi:hypothetical protein
MDDADAKRALAAEKFRRALDLHGFGIAMMRQNFRRHFPNDIEAEIDERLRAWLRRRPPDAPGRAVSWPRHQA